MINLGVLYILLGTLLFASKPILIKLLIGLGLSTTEIMALRNMLSLPFYLLILFYLFKKGKFNLLNKKIVLTILFSGLMCFHVASYLDLKSLEFISANMERIILYCYPTLIMAYGIISKTEIPNRKQLAALALTYLGMIIFFGFDFKGSIKELLGIGLVVLSAMAYSFYVLVSFKSSQQVGSQLTTAIGMTGASLTIFFQYSISHNVSDISFSLEMWVYLFLLAVLATVAASFLLNAGMLRVGPQNGSIIGSTGPFMTAILAIIFLQETLLWQQWCAIFIVVIGILLLKKKPGKAKNN